MPEAFLSHASKDVDAASRLREVLLAHGVPVWFSPHHIQGAQQWHDEIGAALARCDSFILLLTPNAVESMWVKRELLYALREERFNNRIVPVLFADCDYSALSWTLPDFQIIDFRGDYWDAMERLLRVWQKRLKKKVRKQFESWIAVRWRFFVDVDHRTMRPYNPPPVFRPSPARAGKDSRSPPASVLQPSVA